MTGALSYAAQAELALAAYANLDIGEPNQSRLRQAGMSLSQASRFANSWTVVAQYNVPSIGLSATVFADNGNNKFLAIRGTDDGYDLATDLVDILFLGSTAFQPQYAALKSKVREWIANGTLSSVFPVAGHSLGGFLATGIAADFAANVSHAYLYNSPGLGGIRATNASISSLASALGIASPIDASRVSNIKADAGPSPIAGLGYQVAPVISVTIENQLDPDIPFSERPVAFNHAMGPLTDALAIHALLPSLEPALSNAELASLIRSSSAYNRRMLESSLDIVRRAFGASDETPIGNRDALYANLYALQQTITQGEYTGAIKIMSLNSVSDIAIRAQQSNADGLAYRHALRSLDPFVLLGSSAFHTAQNQNGELDLYDASSNTGTLTESWLQDRAEFLAWKVRKNTRDIADDVAIQRKDFGPESYLFTDKTLKNTAGQDYSIRVQGGSVLQQVNPVRISFGGVGPDELSGGNFSDHLYGGGGADVLDGGEGSDYLEGGAGNDAYVYSSANDLGGHDVIFDADGLGSIRFDGVILGGGNRTSGNHYLSADGQFSYSFVGDTAAFGILTINDAIEIRNFSNGALGITLEPAQVQEDPEYDYHYVGSVLTDGPDDLAFQLGSDFNDQYQTEGIENEDGDVELGARPGFFQGKAGDDLYEGSYVEDGDNAWGGPGNDQLYGGALGAGLPPDPTAGRHGDSLVGGAGQDTIVGGQFDDHLYGDFKLLGNFSVDNPYSPSFSLDIGDELRIRFDAVSGQFKATWDDAGIGISDVRSFVTLRGAIDYALGTGGLITIDGLYDDSIDGDIGNDIIFGGNGSDSIYGGDGDDRILGDADQAQYLQSPGLAHSQLGFGKYAYLLGLPGDDYIDGGDGDDVLTDAIAGNDILYGGNGNDYLDNRDLPLADGFFEDGSAPQDQSAFNILDGGSGDDVIYSRSFLSHGFDQLRGGDGNDEIHFSGHDARIDGGDGDDQIEADSQGAVTVDGGAGDDLITVLGRDVMISGGTGSDTIVAEANHVVIDQIGSVAGDFDRLQLSGLASVEVDLAKRGNDLVLTSLFSGWTVTVAAWFDGSDREIDEISFADDVIWTPADVSYVLAHPQHVPSSGNDILSAHPDSPIVKAMAGDDVVIAGQGSVFVDGGDGADEITLTSEAVGFLIGGKGDDFFTGGSNGNVFAFNRGDGTDVIETYGGTISLGGGIARQDILITETGGDIQIDLGMGDSITLVGALDSPFAPDHQGDLLLPLLLQIISPNRIDTYDLRSANLNFYSSVDSAMGGVIAYQFGVAGTVDSIATEHISATLNDPNFGLVAQSVLLASNLETDPNPEPEPEPEPETDTGGDGAVVTGQDAPPAGDVGDDLTTGESVQGSSARDSLQPYQGNGFGLGEPSTDVIALKDWYAQAGIVENLQSILDADSDRGQNIDFALSNSQYESPGHKELFGMDYEPISVSESPGLNSWVMTNALLHFHQSGADAVISDSALVFHQGKVGQFTALGQELDASRTGASVFGRDAQNLQVFSGLPGGIVVLA